MATKIDASPGVRVSLLCDDPYYHTVKYFKRDLTYSRNSRFSEIKNDLGDGLRGFVNAKEITDFHVTSTWGVDLKKGWDYVDEDTIIFYSFTKAYVEAQMKKVLYKPSPLDFWIPVSTPPYHFDDDCMHVTGDFELFYEFGKNYEIRWGNGIMYEQAIPLGLYMGCKEFVTIGYDIGQPGVDTQKHAYDDTNMKLPKADDKKLMDYIRTTTQLYDWFQKEGVNFRILSDTNPSDARFERINNLGEI